MITGRPDKYGFHSRGESENATDEIKGYKMNNDGEKKTFYLNTVIGQSFSK